MTEYVSVRELEAADVPQLVSVLRRSRDHMSGFLKMPDDSVAGITAALARRVAANRSGGAWHAVICVRKDTVGFLSLHPAPPAAAEPSDALDLTIVVAPWAPRGTGSHAVRLGFQHAFADLGLSSIRAVVRADNIASIASLTRAGMVPESPGAAVADGFQVLRMSRQQWSAS